MVAPLVIALVAMIAVGGGIDGFLTPQDESVIHQLVQGDFDLNNDGKVGLLDLLDAPLKIALPGVANVERKFARNEQVNVADWTFAGIDALSTVFVFGKAASLAKVTAGGFRALKLGPAISRTLGGTSWALAGKASSSLFPSIVSSLGPGMVPGDNPFGGYGTFSWILYGGIILTVVLLCWLLFGRRKGNKPQRVVYY